MTEQVFDKDKHISIQKTILKNQGNTISKLKNKIIFKNLIKKVLNKLLRKSIKTNGTLSFLPYNKSLSFSNNIDSSNRNNIKSLKIALFIHIISIDLLPEIIEQLQLFQDPFDCYISTNHNKKVSLINEALKQLHNVKNLSFSLVNKNNATSYCFFKQLFQLNTNYDLICNINTDLKHYNQSIDIDLWRKYLLKHLLGSKNNIKYILNRFFMFPDIDIIYPPDFPPLHVKKTIMIQKFPILQDLIEHYSLRISTDEIIDYPAGSMFWIKPHNILKILDDKYILNMVAKDKSKTSKTYNIDYELFLMTISLQNNFRSERVFNNSFFKKSTKERITFFVHFDKNDKISQSDFDYITELKRISKELVFITVSNLKKSDLEKVKSKNTMIIERANYGFDFGAWKDALRIYGINNLEKFDEVVFANNSCFAPLFDLQTVFSEMEEKNIDFWGITSHPEVVDNSHFIPFHIQSYFLVFNHQIVLSNQFYNYWTNMPYFESYEDAINNGELKCTEYFSKSFSYAIYCDALIDLIDTFAGYNYSLTEPEAVLICGSPFIKKKVFQFASPEKQKDLIDIVNKITNKSYFTE